MGIDLRTYIAAKLHGLRITECNLDYHGSITLDPDFMDAVGIDTFEQVHVLNCTNGNRLVTYTIAGKQGSKEVGVNGAAAKLCCRGDQILVLCYRSAQKFPGAKVVMFDEHNTPTDRLRYER
jgi:aspartate 1-decarboxylase